MDNKKFETLIDLIINENEEQARELFHDIVVEKSREIYENMMHDEMEEGMGGQVGQMMDEISVEEAGVIEGEEDEEEIDFDDEGDDEIIDIDSDGMDMGGEEELEDRVADIEDKLDQLMAEFEDIMSDGDDGESDAEFDDQAEEDGEDLTKDMEQGRDDEDAMMEAITLKKVSVTHGDNGSQTRSTVDANSGQAGMDSKPVNFSGGTESNPTGPKGPSNAYSKGETTVKGATSWKNAPAQNNFSEKGESTPKPVTKDEAGKVRSPVAESRKPAKRRI
jgi:hypothetical protein